MFSYLVTRPAAPVPVSTSGPHLIAHRRVAKGTGANGGAAHTIATSATTPSTLPTNVTVGVYSDTYAFLRDEFLVSADSGVTWRLVPSPAVVSAGVYTIPAYSSSWATVSDFDNQANQADALNFGEYSAGNNPSLTRYYRLARPCQTLGVELRTPDNDPLTLLDNRMTVGVGGVLGSGGQLTQGSTIVYNSARSNFRPLVGLLGDIIKLTFQLTSYPAEGFASDTVNFRTLIIPDAAVSALPAGWTNNTIRLDPALGFGLPLISRLSSTSVSLAPLQVNFGGILVRNPANRTFTTVEGTSYQITVNTSGEFALRADTYVPAIGEITVISFTPNASGVRVLGCLPLDNPAKVIGGSGVLYGRPVSPSGAAWAAGDLGGVSLGDGSMAIAGDVVVQVTGPVAVGDTLTPASATGFGVGSGPLRVIQGSQGSGAGVAIARLQPVGSGGGGGGLTAEDVDDRVATLLISSLPLTETYDDVANTLTLAINPATTSSAGTLSPADKTKLDGIASGATANSTDVQLRDRTTHTGTQPASTISDFAEAVDDRVNALLVVGPGITKVYDDVANTLTLSVTPVPGTPTGRRAIGRRTAAASQSVTAGVWSIVTYNVETDPEGWLNPSTGILTLPTGFDYEITAYVQISGASSPLYAAVCSGTTAGAGLLNLNATNLALGIETPTAIVSGGTYHIGAVTGADTTLGEAFNVQTVLRVTQLIA